MDKPARTPSTTPARDRLAVLGDHPLFRALDPAALERLGQRATTRTVKRGATIFSKGDAGHSLYALASGTVKIGVPSTEGRDTVFNFVTAGEIFGEIAVLDGRPRTADAVAASDCELIAIDARDFLAFLRDEPELAIRVIAFLCARLRWVSEHVERVVYLGLAGSLARTLLQLIEKSGTSAENRKLAITQRELSQMIGKSRESINKQLRGWAKRKWVRLERGGIVVLAPDALAAVAASDNVEG